PTSIDADGESTSAITVTLRDENDEPVTRGGFDIELFTTAGTLSNITDNGDGTYTATLTSSTEEETAVITGTLEGEDIEDSAEVRFELDALPPSPDFTTIEANPTSILADGESTSAITVTLRNENDETVGRGGFEVTLAATAGSLGDITDNGDGTYTAILTSSTEEEIALITGTVEGEDIADDAEVEFFLPQPSPDFTTITASPTTIAADGESTSAITVTLRDENDEPVTRGGFDIELFTTAGTLSNITDNGDGTYTATLTSSTEEETAVITGTLEGEDINDTSKVNFELDPVVPSPEFTIIISDPDNIPADGESQSSITVILFDENNEPITEGGFCSSIELFTTDGSIGSIADNGDGTCEATLTSSTDPGTAVITGTLGGENIEDDAEVEFTALPPTAQNTTINASPTRIMADGESTSTVRVTLRDRLNQRVRTGGFNVTLSTNAGTLSSVTDNGDGTYTAILTSSSTEEVATITGTLEGDNINDTATVRFEIEILPPSPEFTTIEADPDRILADGESISIITVTLRDENNELVGAGGFDVTISTTAGTLSQPANSDNSILLDKVNLAYAANENSSNPLVDNGDGTYTAILTSSTNEETAIITGTLEGEDIDDSAEVEFVIEMQPPSAQFTTIEADPTEIFADGESTSVVTVTLRDSNDERVNMGGFDVELFTTAGTLSSVTDLGNGRYRATLTSTTTVQTAAITGRLEGETINDSAEVDFILAPITVDPRFIQIIAEHTEIPADGQSTSSIQVILYDSNNERITDGGFCQDISLSTTMGTLSNLTDNGDGTCSATLTSSEEPGEAIISGTYKGDEIDDTVTVTFLSLDMFSCTVEAAYPNPFVDRVTFRITSPAAGQIQFNLYDILGKNVATIANQDVTAGEHEIVFDGGQLSSGVYIYRLVCPCSCASDSGRITRVGRN
ncbi:MAG: T9SS type A sorting domain-containing protein, partial [Balneolaceae bacterium]|nr:T9SS type A sorting domain-containing protein [Balneolaceae bacterium]